MSDRTETTYTDMPVSYWKEQALMAWREVNKFAEALAEARAGRDETANAAIDSAASWEQLYWHEVEKRGDARRWARRMYRKWDHLRRLLFDTRCKEHLDKRHRTGLYCATCGKPMAGIRPRLTYKQLVDEQDDISDERDRLAERNRALEKRLRGIEIFADVYGQHLGEQRGLTESLDYRQAIMDMAAEVLDGEDA